MVKRIVILGGGESGVGAAILAKLKGFDVFLSDMGSIAAEYKEALNQYKISFEEGGHTANKVLNADEVIKSPGIPDTAPLVESLREQNIPVISEIEFAGRYSKAKHICITGSNGKTTTSMLCYHMLSKLGLNVGLAGNVGKSFAWQVATKQHDIYVLELSSFQLDGMYDFKADVAILLNITPDHLDRYDNNFQNYVNSKFRIIQNQTNKDFFIYWNGDKVIEQELEKREINANCLPFGEQNLEDSGAMLDGEELNIKWENKDFIMSISEIGLSGKHNAYNSMAASLAGKAVGIKNQRIRESFSGFTGVEHRLELVRTVKDIDYINDSKSTNVNSTWYALESATKPTIWIVGGVDKGNDYSELDDLVAQKVKVVICLGKDNKKILDHFGSMVGEILEVQSMEKAVQAAGYFAESGDSVLLSPACASFDLFTSYEDRGSQFKKNVSSL